MRPPRAGEPLLIFLLILATALGVVGCGPQALPPRATRTPLPTFTPTVVMTREPLAYPAATPEVATEERPLFLPSVAKEGEVSLLVTAGRFILVDQKTQQMHVYEDGVEIRTIPCSTGIPDQYPTPAWSGVVGPYWGTFLAEGLYADDAWFLFKDHGSILIHSLPYTYQGRTRIYQGEEALGRYPSSHGCIRIHPEDARWLKSWNPAGVPITITPWEAAK
ncbi:MAG: L,D-transpeptidase [Anaerolineae bacterium]